MWFLPNVATAQAQFLGNQCRTTSGQCQANPAPVGAPCECLSTQGRRDTGVIVAPGTTQMQTVLGDLCRTFRGICQIQPSPAGSKCFCYGEPGQVMTK
jgi:hypothetical protein